MALPIAKQVMYASGNYGKNLMFYSLEGPTNLSSYALYDIIEDPQETANVAAAHPDLVQRLFKELQDWRESVAASRSDNGL